MSNECRSFTKRFEPTYNTELVMYTKASFKIIALMKEDKIRCRINVVGSSVHNRTKFHHNSIRSFLQISEGHGENNVSL